MTCSYVINPDAKQLAQITLLIIFTIFLSAPCSAQSDSVFCKLKQVDKLLGSNLAPNDYFGRSVFIGGNWAAIGAPGADSLGVDAGAVYIYEFDGVDWMEVQILCASDAAAGDGFGQALSMNEDRLVVGAPGKDETVADIGAAYIFERNGSTWLETHKLLASDGGADDHFGNAVSLSGDRMVIGAAGVQQFFNPTSSAAYIYQYDPVSVNWTEMQVIEGNYRDEFATSVSIDGNRVIIGSPKWGDDFSSQGAAFLYFYNGSTWVPDQMLQGSDIEDFDEFGNAVAIDGSRVIVGASMKLLNGSLLGSAYIFDFNGFQWMESQQLFPADGFFTARFGSAVAISGERVLIGARDKNENGPLSGAAYIYDYSGSYWTEIQKLTPSDGTTSHQFGQAVSLFGDRALIGARAFNGGINAGAAYLFDTCLCEITFLSDISVNPDCSYLLDLTVIGSLHSSYQWSTGDSTEDIIITLPGTYSVTVIDQTDTFCAAIYAIDFQPDLVEVTKLLPTDGENHDRLGNAVSVNGDIAIAGAPLDDDNGYNAGAAYIYSYDGLNWTAFQKVIASDGAAGDAFGSAVVVKGNWLVVGAPYRDIPGMNRGAAYVFEYDGIAWVEAQIIGSPGSNDGDQFGSAIELYGNYMLISSPRTDDASPIPGSAYIFEHDGMNWVETDQLIPADSAMGFAFGFSVHLDSTHAIIGAIDKVFPPYHKGKVYVFEKQDSGWVEVQTIIETLTAASTDYGHSLDKHGNWLIVGSPKFGFLTGLIYTYENIGGVWTRSQLIHNPNPASFAGPDYFGGSIAIAGDRFLAGAHLYDWGLSPQNDAGVAYLYEYKDSLWTMAKTLLPKDNNAGHQFGRSIAFQAGRAILGAPFFHLDTVISGAAYIYDICPPDLEAPECDVPAGTFTSNITETTAILSWDSVPGATGYELQGVWLGGPSGITIPLSANSQTSFDAFGLLPGFTYIWHVRAICEGNDLVAESAYSENDTFTTLRCLPPNPIFSSNISATTATLNWTAQPVANGYKIYGGKVGGEIVTITIPDGSTSSLDVINLSPGTAYVWSLVNQCASGDVSLFALPDVFTTLPSIVQKKDEGVNTAPADWNFTIFPNPAAGHVYISHDDVSDDKEIQIKLYDANGKLIHLSYSPINEQAYLIEVKDLANGVYHVWIQGNHVAYHEKLIIAR